MIVIFAFRFGTMSTYTVDLLASCLNCLSAMISPTNVSEVALQLFATSVLPCLERPLAVDCDAATLMTTPVFPGVIGTALAGNECPHGAYPLTTAFLKLAISFVQVIIAVGVDDILISLQVLFFMTCYCPRKRVDHNHVD